MRATSERANTRADAGRHRGADRIGDGMNAFTDALDKYRKHIRANAIHEERNGPQTTESGELDRQEEEARATVIAAYREGLERALAYLEHPEVARSFAVPSSVLAEQIRKSLGIEAAKDSEASKPRPLGAG